MVGCFVCNFKTSKRLSSFQHLHQPCIFFFFERKRLSLILEISIKSNSVHDTDCSFHIDIGWPYEYIELHQEVFGQLVISVFYATAQHYNFFFFSGN